MRSLVLRALLPALLLPGAVGCSEGTPASTGHPAASAASRQAPTARPGAKPLGSAEQGPIRMEELKLPDAPPVFVLRGVGHEGRPMVFLHGMCGHGLGYAQSFQFSAARLGRLVAPQGDVSCGGVWSKWSADVAALDARIERTFRELGHETPLADVLVIGMSQGASRAADLARRWPERYTRLIAMAGPTPLNATALRSLRASVTMAGARDRQDLMRQSARALQNAGVPSTFMLIPEASHGAMGPTPEKTMAEALAFVFSQQRPER